MQMKTIDTLRYHLTSIRIGTIKKTEKNQWGCGEIGTLVHCWWQCKIVHPLWKIVWWFFKVKNRTTIWSSNPTSGYTTKRTENRVSKRYLYTHVLSSIIHNSQNVEATQVSTDGWMDKHTVVYTYNGILFSLNKEGNSAICYSMDETWGYYAKQNKSQKDKYYTIHLYEV